MQLVLLREEHSLRSVDLLGDTNWPLVQQQQQQLNKCGVQNSQDDWNGEEPEPFDAERVRVLVLVCVVWVGVIPLVRLRTLCPSCAVWMCTRVWKECRSGGGAWFAYVCVWCVCISALKGAF